MIALQVAAKGGYGFLHIGVDTRSRRRNAETRCCDLSGRTMRLKMGSHNLLGRRSTNTKSENKGCEPKARLQGRSHRNFQRTRKLQRIKTTLDIENDS